MYEKRKNGLKTRFFRNKPRDGIFVIGADNACRLSFDLILRVRNRVAFVACSEKGKVVQVVAEADKPVEAVFPAQPFRRVKL